MLIGTSAKSISHTDTVLAKMGSSKTHCFLTGSRYFGWERPDSDWDFFTANSKLTETYLFALGFKEDTKEGYSDSLTRKVFMGHSIHVQLVTSVAQKQELNTFFSRNKRLLASPQYNHNWDIIWTPLSKQEQRIAWQTAVSLYQSIRLRSW